MPGSMEATTEELIQAKGLTAPRLTPAYIDAVIVAEDYNVFPDTTTTLCELPLKKPVIVQYLHKDTHMIARNPQLNAPPSIASNSLNHDGQLSVAAAPFTANVKPLGE